ncbi:carboxymuconolactone decarboxylase family protein [Thioalkalivibrio sp.]|uniref:carboxymuconolactone decarboxylase family protein n=1 Tax=Thioalkalivibrio sp. TaxID=2093813 RepID=UPI0012D55DD8|nr:carboxymuconolactone decarboxylase family protein [Thioalkalivibrio sp.]TVP79276.1 MAG: carboxymuconolactone decarboxylase family protein [Thioalkalivibrio sp.]
MARIPSPPIRQYPWFVRWVLRRQERKYGSILAPSLLWGRLPGTFVGMLGLLGIFNRRSYPVGPGLRSLVSIRIAQCNGCSFCVDLNAYHYLEATGATDKAANVSDWLISPLYDPPERAALAYAEKVTERCSEVSEADIDGLREHFNDDQITALTAWIAFQNMSAKFNAALGAEEHGFCALPARRED